jgi:YbgC/YbaW family acyl-CoA thioester hydrolase
MPYLYTRNFTVRYYECDAYGQVAYANYLRYMQEAAFDASASVGYNVERDAGTGCRWLAYETDIEYLRPLKYKDPVQVRTWIVDFRRVRSRRGYELRCNGEVAARAVTDWVLIDTATLRPVTIPPEMIAAYSHGEPIPPAEPRAALPQAEPPAAGAFQMQRRVEWSELDTAGHVNNAVYLNYVRDCEVGVEQAHGWSPARLKEAPWQLTTRRHQIEYKAAATWGDELTITTWLSDPGETAMIRHFTITRAADGCLLTRVRAVLECADRVTRQPLAIPSALREDFAPNMAGD